ncbi:hypothetical protein CQA49_05935 [Helicobacter sp. MIT 00-7814]|uniref:PBECR3 domain-containing polyvalent protein n=1 Tax=unclassified Helicobacter TaxID=2593540 RepID=UPI000E1F9B98|nr:MULTISPECIES: hypothetical protein [unclassified Helicobacter]RDU53939.1 hypothetical protein CQA49_05935 [Helicobacter sp. MIT 00-7814]RDU57069.1 hypothetical protein CQA37_01295 [Helicobacter sp. MIT 99-10781]
MDYREQQKIAIDILDPTKAQELGFKYPQEVKRTISGYEIRHAYNKHKTDKIPLTLEHIEKWIYFVDKAQVQTLKKDTLKQDVIVSEFRNDDGIVIVVESIRKKTNELSFKTMYLKN